MSVLSRTLAISDFALHSPMGKPRPTPRKGLVRPSQRVTDGSLEGRGPCGVAMSSPAQAAVSCPGVSRGFDEDLCLTGWATKEENHSGTPKCSYPAPGLDFNSC